MIRKQNLFRRHTKLLGYSRSKTTEICTHVSPKNIQQIKSLFDEL